MFEQIIIKFVAAISIIELFSQALKRFLYSTNVLSTLFTCATVIIKNTCRSNISFKKLYSWQHLPCNSIVMYVFLIQQPNLFYVYASLSAVWSWSWVYNMHYFKQESLLRKNIFLQNTVEAKRRLRNSRDPPYIVRYVPKVSFWECSYALSTSVKPFL